MVVPHSGIEPLSTLAPVLQTGVPTMERVARDNADEEIDKSFTIKRCKPIRHSAWWESQELNLGPQRFPYGIVALFL